MYTVEEFNNKYGIAITTRYHQGDYKSVKGLAGYGEIYIYNL
jgi:hypothetical protein